MRRILIASFAAALGATPLAACHKAPAAAGPNASLDAAKTWLANNGKQPGVVTLPSGLQYKIITSGPAGGVHPRLQDEAKVFYEGKQINGEVFDSSFDRGVADDMHLTGNIPGFTEALQLMRPGDEWVFYMPPNLGYGDSPPPNAPFPPNAVLIFRIRLVDVLPGVGPALPPGPPVPPT